MKISSILCFSVICVFLEARPDISSHSSVDSISVDNDSPTTNENANQSDNVDRDEENIESTALPALLDLRSENNDYESDIASSIGIAETKDQSIDKYASDEQILDTSEIIQEMDHDGKSNRNDYGISKENTENKKGIVDDNSQDSTSEEQSNESNEEDTSELDLSAPLENTRRMISYPTAKPADVVTRPGDNAGQNLESRAAFGLQTPMIPLRPIAAPTIIPTATVPKSPSFTTSIPYPNPLKYQTFPNPATFLKLPLNSYNRKPYSGMPIFPKTDLSRPVLSLIDDFAAEPYSNAYPFISSTPAPLDIFPQDIFPKNLYSKLMQASEHPVQFQPALYPFRNPGFPNPNFFLGQNDFTLRPHTLKRNL